MHVYTLTKVYAEEHMLLLCMRAGRNSYLLPVLEIAKIVYIDDRYRSKTIVSTPNIPDPKLVFHFDYVYFIHYLTSVLQ